MYRVIQDGHIPFWNGLEWDVFLHNGNTILSIQFWLCVLINNHSIVEYNNNHYYYYVSRKWQKCVYQWIITTIQIIGNFINAIDKTQYNCMNNTLFTNYRHHFNLNEQMFCWILAKNGFKWTYVSFYSIALNGSLSIRY